MIDDDDKDTEMMWHYLESTPSINKIDLPDKYNDIKNVRLTLDYIEDYWLLDTVRRILGEDTSRQRINSLFLNNRDLHLINWFRNVEWKQKQESKNPYK